MFLKYFGFGFLTFVGSLIVSGSLFGMDLSVLIIACFIGVLATVAAGFADSNERIK